MRKIKLEIMIGERESTRAIWSLVDDIVSRPLPG